MTWQVGVGRRVITPSTPVWLAGYGTKRAPDGKIHDLWVKALALQEPGGKRVVLATTDHMGISKTIYEGLYAEVHARFGLERSEFMLTFSHNHCGPVLRDDLVDYYPLDDEQRRLVDEYSQWMEEQAADAVGDALEHLQPGRLFKGEGQCTFAVNRRENAEADVPQLLAEGKPLKGVVDHYVPVLAVRCAPLKAAPDLIRHDWAHGELRTGVGLPFVPLDDLRVPVAAQQQRDGRAVEKIAH